MKPSSPKPFRHLKEGDEITRLLGGTIPMKLRITYVDDNLIYCGPWKFDRDTGVEIDEDLTQGIVSYIELPD